MKGIVVFLLLLPTALADCKADWTVQNHTNSIGASLQHAFTTLEACKSGCVADRTCKGIDADFRYGDIRCYVHTAATIYKDTMPRTKVFQYILNERCVTSSDGIWILRHNTSSSGGSSQAALTTVEACQNGCVDDINCKGIDMDLGAGKTLCWFHTDASLANTVVPTDVFQYALKDCCVKRCKAVWTLQDHTHSIGAVSQADITSVEACQSGCVDDATCKGIDIVTRAGEKLCWFHTDASLHNHTRMFTGIFKYVLIDRCVTTLTCTAQWTAIDKRSSSGGVQKSEYTTTEACKAGCQAATSCVAAEVWDLTDCWFHLNKNNLDRQWNSPGAVQFVLDDRCVTSPALIMSSPGIQKVALGQQLEVTWTLRGYLGYLGVFEIYPGWSNATGSSSYAMKYTITSNNEVCNIADMDRWECIYNSSERTIGFRIPSVQDQDASRYSIVVQLSALESGGTLSNQDAVVFITKRPATPQITGNQILNIGDSTTLTCAASSQSLPPEYRANTSQIVYTWSWSGLPGRVLSNGNQIHVGPVGRQHDGQRVRCTARERDENKSSTADVTVHVHYPPSKPELIISNWQPTQGDPVTLTCSVDGRPTSQIRFFNVTGGESVELGRSSHGNNSATYRLPSVDCLHSGEYRCWANNKLGESSSDGVQLSVKCQARAAFFVPSTRTTRARLGETVMFEVGLIADPLEQDHITWSHTAMETSSLSSGVERRLHGNVAVLVIRLVQEKHYGNYTIQVNNGINSDIFQADFELAPTVTFPSWIKDIGLSVLGVLLLFFIVTAGCLRMRLRNVLVNAKRKQEASTRNGQIELEDLTHNQPAGNTPCEAMSGALSSQSAILPTPSMQTTIAEDVYEDPDRYASKSNARRPKHDCVHGASQIPAAEAQDSINLYTALDSDVYEDDKDQMYGNVPQN